MHKGVYHKISPKHLQRYVDQFAAKHNIRDKDTRATKCNRSLPEWSEKG